VIKNQLLTGEPRSVVAKTISKMEGLLIASAASLVYAGYPYDPFDIGFSTATPLRAAASFSLRRSW
jgi:hypothetical protein